MKPFLLSSIALGLLAGGLLLLPTGGQVREDIVSMDKSPLQNPQPSKLSDAPLPSRLDLLFIHHSCGGQWLAPVGPDIETNAIYASSPNGGDLKRLLTEAGYDVHEAAYNSRVGHDTDVFHWPAKFQNQMDDILRCRHQDEPHPPGITNRIVIFKSCYPNSGFVGRGGLPGDPHGPALTVENAKAAYTDLLVSFRSRPDTLFVCVSAPPLAPVAPSMPLWRQLARRLKGTYWDYRQSGALAREFNTWLSDPNGWLKDYALKNVVVFDYYHVLTGHGKSNFAAYPTGQGSDSHPSAEGNQLATREFVPFLNRAARRAQLVP